MAGEPNFAAMRRAESGDPVYWDGGQWWVFVAQGRAEQSGVIRDGPFAFDTQLQAVAFVNGLCVGMQALDLKAVVVTPAKWRALAED